MHKLIEASVFAAIGVLVFASLLIPVVDDAQITTGKITNIGAYNLTDDDDNYTIVFDPSGKYIIGDTEIPFNDLPVDAITIASAKDMLLRMQNWAAQNHNLWLFIDGQTPRIIANDLNDSPVTITFNDGALIWGTQNDTYTSDDSFRAFNPDGAYTMTLYNQPATVLKDTTVIIGNGTTAVNAWTNRFYIEGTTEDIEITPAAGITVSNIEVNTTAINTYKDAVKLDSITFTATDGENTVDATYNRVIVPREITAELSVHADEPTREVLAVLPLILICALIMGVVGYAVYSRIE